MPLLKGYSFPWCTFSLVGLLRGVTSKLHRKLAPPEGRQHDPKAKTSSTNSASAQSYTLRHPSSFLSTQLETRHTRRRFESRGSSSLSLSLTLDFGLHLWCFARSPTTTQQPASFSASSAPSLEKSLHQHLRLHHHQKMLFFQLTKITTEEENRKGKNTLLPPLVP